MGGLLLLKHPLRTERCGRQLGQKELNGMCLTVCCELGYTAYNKACSVGHHGRVQLEKWPVVGTPCDVPYCPYIS